MSIGGGVEQRGKTRGKQFGIDGPKLGIQTGGKGKGGSGGGKKQENMKAVGRTRARLRAQGGE